MRIPWYLTWPLLALALYGALRLVAWRATYYPLKHPRGIWDAKTWLGAEDVWLQSADGVRLHTWWISSPGSPIATLFLHGNGGNLTHRIAHLQAIRDAGSSVLILDYRGYGRSQGRPSETGLYRDAHAAYLHLRKAGYPPSRIVLHGESLGCAVAVELASREPCAGMILEAPFTSAADVARRVLPFLGPLAARGFDSRRRIASFRRPLLVIHGTRDEVIPFELGQRLFKSAPGPKWFWVLKGAGHNDILETAGLRYVERLKEFYAQIQD